MVGTVGTDVRYTCACMYVCMTLYSFFCYNPCSSLLKERNGPTISTDPARLGTVVEHPAGV